MKQNFQMLNDPRFNLVYGNTDRYTEMPLPNTLRLNREGFTVVDGIKKKTKVHPYMLLAEHPSIDKGDLFSPVHGEVTEVSDRSVFIKVTEPVEDAPTVEPIDLLEEGLFGQDLIMAVKKLGVNTKSLAKECKTLIINGLNPDPGVTWAEPMLTNHAKHLNKGIELHKRMTRAEKVLLAVPHGTQLSYDGIEIVHVPTDYPNSVSELLIKNVTGKENPEDVACVSIHNIWSLGRVGATGLPLIETVMTVGSYTKWKNYIVKDGSTIGDILQAADITIEEGDTVLRGGPLRGESLDSLARSITKGTHGVFVVEAGSVPRMEGHSPCVNCGACVLICPARLSPSTLSRNAEFALYERCRSEHVFSCLECGLCGYVCIARRPVLQYIRLAHQKIREEDARKAALELEELELGKAE